MNGRVSSGAAVKFMRWAADGGVVLIQWSGGSGKSALLEWARQEADGVGSKCSLWAPRRLGDGLVRTTAGCIRVAEVVRDDITRRRERSDARAGRYRMSPASSAGHVRLRPYGR